MPSPDPGIVSFLEFKKKVYPIRKNYLEFCKKFMELDRKENRFLYELQADPDLNYRNLAQE